MADAKICKKPGCEKPLSCRGLCKTHYSELRRQMSPDCAVDGCHRRGHAKGMCSLHYGRMRQFGDHSPRKANHGATEAFIDMAILETSDTCLLWPFSKVADGYGQARYKQKNCHAHRMVCELVHGVAPSPIHQAAHRCGNSSCVNPKHLRWATPAENSDDRFLHSTVPFGEMVKSAKLTTEQVRLMKRMFATTRVGKIAETFGISQSTVSRIKAGQAWRHV